MLVGVISDTHGYLDPRVENAFAGVEAIIHAGDVGSVIILEALARMAPVHAVRGNNDAAFGGLDLPEHLDLELAGHEIHLVHRLIDAHPTPGARVVVFGHSHRALSQWRGGVLYLNPGAAGRRGFHAVLSVAVLRFDPDGVEAELRELGPRLQVVGSRLSRQR